MIDPRELQGVDLRTFTVRITRQEFRELPLRWVLTPCLDAPVLVFKHEDQGRASVLSADLDTWREAYPKTSVPESLKRIARAARDAHLRRVALAVGYTWPGNPPGYVEFAADA